MGKNEGEDTFESGRMYEIIEDFVSKFDKIIIKEEARSVKMKDPITHENTDLTSLIGHLVADYVRLTDAVNSSMKEPASPDRDYLLTGGRINRLTTAIGLSEAIHLARARHLLDEGLEKKLTELEEKNATLESALQRCKEEYQALKEKYDGFRRLVRDPLSTVEEDGEKGHS